ncbi:hypothetical protein K432DRAFT_438909 [Lepidopterella palustris CBS 459.81]|uniref:RING-type domain-containing protein n=1 Tax=Lepidopterella palustris CBS 459.81 TaxID=1314670 RepID=A0A8E2ELZ5_9PEZI|nr:hypothetical protein K432DRAFT_438909 [Lepidopterella palustris CBS 459.81]
MPDIEIIDLLSDSDCESDNADTPRNTPPPDPGNSDDLYGYDLDWDLGFPELDPQPEPEPEEIVEVAPAPFTEDDCLNKLLEIFPDISHDHVLTLFRNGNRQGMHGSAWCDELIVQVLDSGKYPKETDTRQELKRKRRDSIDEEDIARFQQPGREMANHAYYIQACNLLRDEFQDIPVKHIQATLRSDHTLFKAYFTLEQQLRVYDLGKENPFSRVSSRRNKRPRLEPPEDLTQDQGNSEIMKEFFTAKKKSQRDNAQREKEAQKAIEEEKNLKKARATGTMTECGCCFDDYPINRMTYCNGPTAHFFCWECTRQHVESQMGQSKCRPLCMSTDSCDAEFTNELLKALLDEKIFVRLELMQQQEDIRAAGIQNLEDCPFCDFKAECPPVEVDKEFRCQKPDCKIVSCRLCRLETHIPQTCEEFAKENKLHVRHTVEEAMTKALIRNCNKCKNPFVKETGCNKMRCTRCLNEQCYVCSKNVKNYDHFGAGPGKCPLHDDTDARHDEEVKKAEATAAAQVRAENPDLSEEDLKIKVSDRVQHEEEARRKRAAALINLNHQPQFPIPPVIFAGQPPMGVHIAVGPLVNIPMALPPVPPNPYGGPAAQQLALMLQRQNAVYAQHMVQNHQGIQPQNPYQPQNQQQQFNNLGAPYQNHAQGQYGGGPVQPPRAPPIPYQPDILPPAYVAAPPNPGATAVQAQMWATMEAGRQRVAALQREQMNGLREDIEREARRLEVVHQAARPQPQMERVMQRQMQAFDAQRQALDAQRQRQQVQLDRQLHALQARNQVRDAELERQMQALQARIRRQRYH